ncbi:MAG: ATP-binding cassette domain-containing protein [Planctomycetota bacterium]|nr:ATP-binding cassette domain-containing protein [Planctomycetota bacterium]
MPQDSILSLNQLCLKRGGRVLAQDLELSLGGGEAGLVLGSNGSGKTTLSETICGFLKPHAGSVTKPKQLGWASQDPRFPLRSRCHNYLFQLAVLGGSPSKIAKLEADTALARFGLDEYAKRTIGSLSRGWQQRLNLARAWLGHIIRKTGFSVPKPGKINNIKQNHSKCAVLRPGNSLNR